MLIQEVVFYKGVTMPALQQPGLEIASKGDRDGTQIPQLRVAFFFFFIRETSNIILKGFSLLALKKKKKKAS